DLIRHLFNKFNKLINGIGILLDKLEQEEEKREKGNTINDLMDKLIEIDSELNELILCKSCKGRKITNKLSNILNRLTNKNYLTVEITRLSNELLETSRILENCASYKDKMGEYCYFNKFNKSINEIANLLDQLEEGERENRIDNL